MGEGDKRGRKPGSKNKIGLNFIDTKESSVFLPIPDLETVVNMAAFWLKESFQYEYCIGKKNGETYNLCDGDACKYRECIKQNSNRISAIDACSDILFHFLADTGNICKIERRSEKFPSINELRGFADDGDVVGTIEYIS